MPALRDLIKDSACKILDILVCMPNGDIERSGEAIEASPSVRRKHTPSLY